LCAQGVADSTLTLVLRARAYDRAGQLDSARAAYAAAADQLPRVGDWLRLRAAGVTPDSASRAADYAAIVNPVARTRVAWTEAEARERTGDLVGASRAYAALGARLDALRDSAAAIAGSNNDSTRLAIRSSLLAIVADHSGASDARAAIEILDRYFAPLTAAEELTVGRSAGVGGPAVRAVAAFDRVAATMSIDSLPPRDAFLYATALARIHRDADAARVYAGLATRPRTVVPPALAHAALYQRGRALVAAGDRAAARTVLRGLLRVAPRDTVCASALMLLADLATDDHKDADARRTFLAVTHQFPQSLWAPRAAFHAALIAYVGGTAAQAAREWDALVVRYPRSDDSSAARYWAGRAWARAGKRRLANVRWRKIIASDPLSYYAILSARRLGTPAPIASIAPDTAASPLAPPVDSAITRAAELEGLGMETEARFEVDYALQTASGLPAGVFGAGVALARVGEAHRAVSIGWRLVDRSDSAWRDPRVLRLIYPLAYGDTLAELARAKGLDPALVAAIVRQESAFNPHAVSVVGARGLMQIMPSVGRGLAVSRRLDPSDPTLLDEPGVNLTFGVAHLATFFALEGGSVVRTLAAYNAGPSRVAAWVTKRGSDDPEVFVERIPFPETRDYVRAILRGREVYAKLYDLAMADHANPASTAPATSLGQ
jgi:soluble lytic murein transglycosylase